MRVSVQLREKSPSYRLPRYLLIHIEIESEFRHAIDERMWRYFMHLRLKYHRPVLSAGVFLTGGPPGVRWRTVVETVGPLEVCRFRFLAFGLSRSLAEDYVERPQALAPALAALMRSEVWDNVEKKLHCLRAISQADLDEARRFLLAKVVETYVELDSQQQERFTAELGRQANKEVRNMVITWEETLAAREAKGEAKGEARGRAEGEARGEAKATRENIVLFLTHRFGSVPSAVREGLDRIEDLDRLHEILEQSLRLESMEELNLD